VLIEALFEYTKLTNDGIELKIEQVNINELIDQLIEELIPLFDDNNIEITKNIPSEKIYLKIDSDKMVRVFENILMNAVKYGYKPGQINVEVSRQDSKLIISISNRGEHIEEAELEKLFDRFYRVDKARSATSGGSGLGLAIAKSIVDLHGGRIWAKSEGNVITFVIELNI
jgi:signal transduction histidine kinase